MTDSEERVWVASGNGRSGSRSKVYHTDSDCRCIRGSFPTRPLSALSDEYSECSVCAEGEPEQPEQESRRSLEGLIADGEVETIDAGATDSLEVADD